MDTKLNPTEFVFDHLAKAHDLGQGDVAKALGVSPQAVSQWRKSGRIPTRRAVQISRRWRIPLESIRPDLL